MAGKKEVLKSDTSLELKKQEDIKLWTIEDVKKWIEPKATDKECMMFLALCKTQNLNPFLNEAYLIKYEAGKPAQIVVGKETFLKRANRLPDYEGFEAGIIVKTSDDKIERRAGSFVAFGEVLLGGWCKVFRKDRPPVVAEVSLKEYDTGMSLWKRKPATMIRKVAIVQAHREAYPEEFAGMYDASEMGVETPEKSVNKSLPETKAIELPPELKNKIMEILDTKDVPEQWATEIKDKIVAETLTEEEAKKFIEISENWLPKKKKVKKEKVIDVNPETPKKPDSKEKKVVKEEKIEAPDADVLFGKK